MIPIQVVGENRQVHNCRLLVVEPELKFCVQVLDQCHTASQIEKPEKLLVWSQAALKIY